MTSGLVMDRIHHAFGANEVLKDVSIVAEAGKLTCLLGPSGCGKTTLLRLAAGLETVQNGQIHLNDKLVGNGKEKLSLPPEKRDIGLMFQDYALFPHLSVFDNIAFGLKTVTAERRQWITEGLERMGLAEHRNSFPHMLSGGQQQRVALLRALAPEPQILLLDEPFSGLDVTRRAQVREDTLNFLKECGVAVLMVTHDPEEAMFMADHIVVMKDGIIEQQGSPMEIYLKPTNVFVTTFIGAPSMNILDATLFPDFVEFEGQKLYLKKRVSHNGLLLPQSGKNIKLGIRPDFFLDAKFASPEGSFATIKNAKIDLIEPLGYDRELDA